jgi:hypothetical protein
MPEFDIAFFAGVIDARAHVEPERTRLTVTTNRVHILEWLAKHSGVKATVKEREYFRRGCSEHCNKRHQHISHQSMYWTVRGQRALIIADNVLPYLVQTRDSMYALLLASTIQQKDPLKTEIGAQMARLGWVVSQKKHG